MSRLKEKRESAGLSQGALAKAAGVSAPMIQFYEQGQRDINKAQVQTVYKLAKALNCTIEDIIEIN